ncbi:MAG: ArnT family glycosyltransferase [Chloroflexota bacterium]
MLSLFQPGRRRELVWLGLICLVGLGFRTYRLTTVPSGILYDGAYNGLDALRIVRGARPVFLPADQGREALFIYLQALSIHWLGPSNLALRVPAVIVGSLAIPAAYLVAARLANRRVALLTAAALAVSFWHVTFSRIGLRAISVPLFGAVGFYCLWRGFAAAWSTKESIEEPPRARWQAAGLAWFALSGIVLGLSLYTYPTARFFPVTVLVFAGYLALGHRRKLRLALPGLIVAGLLTAAIFVPEGRYFLGHPVEFAFRANAVSVFNPGLNQGNPLGTLLFSTERSLAEFTFQGDSAWERNVPNWPVFDPVLSAFLALGLLVTLWRLRDPRATFLLLWLMLLLVPSAVSVLQVPNFLRVTGLIPALFILPAVGIDWLWSRWDVRFGPRLAVIPLLVVAAGFGVEGYQTYEGYFHRWAAASGVVQTFNADHWLAVQTARSFVASDPTTIYVGADDADQPSMAYYLDGSGGTRGFQVFDAHYSLILPPEGTAASYIFARRDLPSDVLLNRFFPGQTGRVLARAADGEPIVRYQLPAERSEFQPELSLPARFGDDVQVYGFDVPRDATAGQTITVRWYWKLLRLEPRELTFFNQVVGGDNQKVGSLDARGFTPNYWPAGTRGVSTFDVPIDPSTPTGAYNVLVGLYDHDSREPLTIYDSLGRPAGPRLTLGPIKVHGQPSPAPKIANPHPVQLAAGIDFLGDGLAPASASPGQTVAVTLYWSARSRPTADYTVFVHLLDRSGHVVAQADGPPDRGIYPTSLWDSGETIADPHLLSLGKNLPDGNYSLEVGLYQPAIGQRLPMVDGSGHPISSRILLPGIVVQPANRASP